jgi:flagellar hook-associated protein 3 FlgL
MINGVGSNFLVSQSILNLKNQFGDLQAQLATGKKSTLYSGMGSGEGFAIFARAQLSNISAFTTSMTNINASIKLASTALQSFDKSAKDVQSAAESGNATVNASGQTTNQQTALLQLRSMRDFLNTQAGDRFLFSGSAIDTPPLASVDDILDGNGVKAGLKQLIAERSQADLGASGLGRLVITTPAATPTSVSVAEDVAGSPFGFKLNAIASTFTGATLTGPTGSPPAVSIDLGATNPNDGETLTLAFNLPDGTTEAVKLTASAANPPPTGSFAIGATPAATATNLNAALNTAIGKLASTSLTAASAMAASNDFFNRSVVATGSRQLNNQPAVPAAPITGATLLSGTAPSDSLTASFVPGDTITVNGTPISFVAAGAVGNQLNVTDSVQALLSKIDAISGTPTPSTIAGGAITLNGPVGGLTVTSSATGFAALGLTSPINAVTTTGSSVNNQAAVPKPPITGVTALSGVAPSDSLTTSFAVNDTITVNGTPITFTTAATGASDATHIRIDDTVGNLLAKIDAISGTTTPSTVSNGAITLRGPAAGLTVTSSAAALAALGLSSPINAVRSPLRVNGPPFNTATSVTSGTPANTVDWYTGENGPGSARASLTARVDQTATIQYGIRANEDGIRSALQGVAVFAAVSTSPTNVNAGALISALNQRVAATLNPPGAHQRVSDIETDLANVQVEMKNVGVQQGQAKLTLQNFIDQSETISTEQVASELLALQTSLQASYQTTSMLSQLTLTRFLPIG